LLPFGGDGVEFGVQLLGTQIRDIGISEFPIEAFNVFKCTGSPQVF